MKAADYGKHKHLTIMLSCGVDGTAWIFSHIHLYQQFSYVLVRVKIGSGIKDDTKCERWLLCHSNCKRQSGFGFLLTVPPFGANDNRR